METLFKNSAGKIQDYAANAYKTAGMSANQYMETVTSFSASLLQSLGGDTEKAVDYADMAVQDMSDNANKFGSDISAINTAYQGFAKQNYSMLDNLKLGYGGTAQEMYRLLQDAANLNEEFAETANFSIDSKGHLEAGFADITKAIHIVQEEMDITGTTAREASETISGSVASAKAAWQNLVVGFANDEANLNDLIGQFVESVKTAAGNVIPALTKALTGIGEAVKQIAPIVSEELPGLIEAVLPGLLVAGASLVSGLLNGVVQALPTLADSAVQIIDSLSVTLMGLLPTLLDAGGQMILTLISGLSQTLPQLLGMVPEIIMQLLSSLQTQFPLICEAGIELLQNLASGFASNIPALLEQILPMILSLTETIRNNWTKVVDAGIDLIMKLVDGLIEGLPTLIEYVPTIITNMVGLINDNLPKIINAGITIIGKLVAGLIQAIPTIVKNLPQIINAIVNVFTAFNWINLGKSIITGLGNGLKSMVSFIKNIGSELIQAIKGGFSKLPSEMLNIGKNIVQGVWNGIKGMIGWFTSQVRNFFSSIVSSVKNALGIHSPSKVFAGIGEYMAEGLGEGWNKAYSDVEKLIGRDMDFSGNISTSGTLTTAVGGNAGRFSAIPPVNLTVNVNGLHYMNAADLAKDISQNVAFEMQRLYESRAAVFGT